MARPNRATGAKSTIIFQEETAWGEEAAGQNAHTLDFVSETLRNDINTIESQILRDDRMRSATQQGNMRPGGDINGELQPMVWSIIAKHAIGTAAAPVNLPGLYWRHVLTDSDQKLLEGLSFEKSFTFPDATVRRLKYLGGRVNEFFVSVPTEGIVTCRAGIIGQQEVSDPASAMDATPVVKADNDPFNTFHGTVEIDGVTTACVTSVDLLINNNIDGEQFCIDGSQFRADAPEDIRIVNGNMTIFFTYDEYSLYEKYLTNADASINLELARGSYKWTFDIPKVKLTGSPTPQVSGRGPLNLQFQWEAYRNTPYDIQLTIENGEADLSTATES